MGLADPASFMSRLLTGDRQGSRHPSGRKLTMVLVFDWFVRYNEDEKKKDIVRPKFDWDPARKWTDLGVD